MMVGSVLSSSLAAQRADEPPSLPDGRGRRDSSIGGQGMEQSYRQEQQQQCTGQQWNAARQWVPRCKHAGQVLFEVRSQVRGVFR